VSVALLGAIGNHLWQTTVCAVAAALLAVACRRTRADVRYGIWVAASLKFLVPVSTLIALGAQMNIWRQVDAPPEAGLGLIDAAFTAAPFSLLLNSESSIVSTPSVTVAVRLAVAVWALGTLACCVRWSVGWRHVSRALRDDKPMDAGIELNLLRRLQRRAGIHTPLRIVSSSTVTEPGVVGALRPVLLWPAGLSEHLTTEQIEAILAHELCHVRRRDNLTAVLHMVVEALFWFHPLVWWIGARLIDERERACDEAVVLLGHERQPYAEGLLRACEYSLASRLPCVSGVSGSDLVSRIERILRDHPAPALSPRVRAALRAIAASVVVAPVMIGATVPPRTVGLVGAQFFRVPRLMLASATRSPIVADVPQARFARVSITRALPARGPGRIRAAAGGRLIAQGLTARELLRLAYAPDGHLLDTQLVGLPSWAATERFDIVARAGGDFVTDADGQPRQFIAMVRNVLADRFGAQLHVETRDAAIYALVVATGAGRRPPALRPAARECWRPEPGIGSGRLPRPALWCKTSLQGGTTEAASMRWLASTLTALPSIGRVVRDETGLTGRYDFELPPLAQLDSLGIRLEPRRAPVEVFVIDRISRPTLDRQH
jgi:uncharacterized protein (TIGR03435 family)